MTDVAAVTRTAAVKPGAHVTTAVKAGAKTGTGAADALEGAFAAILDMAADGQEPGAKAVKGGKGAPSLDVLLAQAAKGATGEDPSQLLAGAVARQPQTADTANADDAATALADLPLTAVASLDGVEGGDVAAARTAKAKARKAGEAETDADLDATDPNAQAAAQLTLLSAALPAQAQSADQSKAGKKDTLAIDADKAGRQGGRTAPLQLALQAGKEETQAPVVAGTEQRVPVAPAALKVDAPGQAPSANLAAQADALAARTNDGGQAGGNGGDDRGTGRGNALHAGAKLVSVDTAAAATDPFKDILQSLPPGVQSQLGVSSLSAPANDGAVASAASTGDLLNDKVIDMGVSGQWIDRMAREIASLSDGTGHSRFQLMPPNLGRIQVDLWQGENKTNVRLLTETDEAAQRLRDGQAALEANARLASLSLGSVSVEKSSAPFDSGRDQGQNQRSQAESGGDNRQQAQNDPGAQAQGQSGQGRGSADNRGFSSLMGSERQAEPVQVARARRDDDPRVRFA